MNDKATVAIVGVSGNGGKELLRYVSQNRRMELIDAYGDSSAGKKISDIFPALVWAGWTPNLTIKSWEEGLDERVDLVFLSLTMGKSREVAAQIPKHIRVVDLGGDHRFTEGWTYSIPEITGVKPLLQGCTRVSNPGCYPTAVLLALAPLFRVNYCPQQIIINTNSGLSGMERGGKEAGPSFSDLNEDAWTYKLFNHSHIPEIRKAITHCFHAVPAQVIFTPQCVPMSRGISAVCVMEGGPEDCAEIAQNLYGGSAFVKVVPHSRRIQSGLLVPTWHICTTSRAQRRKW